MHDWTEYLTICIVKTVIKQKKQKFSKPIPKEVFETVRNGVKQAHGTPYILSVFHFTSEAGYLHIHTNPVPSIDIFI